MSDAAHGEDDAGETKPDPESLEARLSALPSTGAADVAAVGGGPRGRETADHQPAVGVHAAGHTASHHQPPPTDADERRTPGKPSHTRSRNNRYTTSHRFIGITRRAPGDTRSNASRPWRAQVNYMGKAHRAPGNFGTAEQAAEAYDELVRQLGLTKERPVNFCKNDGEIAFDRGSTKHAGGRRPGVRKRPVDIVEGDAGDGSEKNAGSTPGGVAGRGGSGGIAAGPGHERGRVQRGGQAGGASRKISALGDEATILEERMLALKGLLDKGIIEREEFLVGKAKLIDTFVTGNLKTRPGDQAALEVVGASPSPTPPLGLSAGAGAET